MALLWGDFQCCVRKIFGLFLLSKQTVDLIHSKRDELNCDLVGSWNVTVGDMDQCLHLWKFTGGFERIDNANMVFKQDPVRFVENDLLY